MSDARFDEEVLKLLCQVAWADDTVAPEEIAAILVAARTAGVSDDLVADLTAALDGTVPLPPPDLAVLRDDPRRAIAAAYELMNADGRIVAEEAAVLAEIEALLLAPNQ